MCRKASRLPENHKKKKKKGSSGYDATVEYQVAYSLVANRAVSSDIKMKQSPQV